MSIRALIFDVDGTLADTEDGHRQAFNAAFLTHGMFWDWSAHRYAELLGVSGGKERMRLYIDSLPVPPEEKARLIALVPLVHSTKVRIYAELVESGSVPLRRGVERLLREALAAGIKLAIASSTTPTNVEALIGATLGHDALGWFNVIVCGELVPAKKPAPDIYELALSSLRLPADACIAFEDSGNGVLAARAAGLVTVVTPTVWTVTQDLSAASLRLHDLDTLGLAELEQLRARMVVG